MFGNDWQPATGTVVDTHVTWSSNGGNYSLSEYIVDVRTADGRVFRARVPQPNNSVHFEAPQPGDVVGVEVNTKDQRVRFDKSDPKLRHKSGRQPTDSGFEELLNQPPGTQPASAATSYYQLPDPQERAERAARWAETGATIAAANELIQQRLAEKRRERGEE